MRISIILVNIFILFNLSFAKEIVRKIKIESNPQSALVSVHYKTKSPSLMTRTIAGITPFTKTFTFKKNQQLMVTLEKRGFLPFTKEILPKDAHISINMEKEKEGNSIPDYVFPEIKNILLITPKMKILERGFKSEEISEEKIKIAEDAITKNIFALFSKKYNILVSDEKPELRKKLKSVFRNSRDAMSNLDPIRLQYLTNPQFLKTESSIKSCQNLGKTLDVQAILVISGNENIETKGMKAGKIGLTVGGTLSSYTASYNQAMSRGDSFFIYNVYTPEFAEGTFLKAALINCSNGEIVWVNRGKWGKINFSNEDIVKKVTKDLFADLIKE